jgi:hypothetical protein
MENDQGKKGGNKGGQKESLLKSVNVDLKGLPTPDFFEARLKIWEDLKQKEKEENATKGTHVLRFCLPGQRRTSRSLCLMVLKSLPLPSRPPRWTLPSPFLRG